MFKSALNPKYQKTVWHYYGQRWGNIHHARLRMGFSKLRSDLFKNYHVIPNESCLCGSHREDATHFLLDCPIYSNLRRIMLQDLKNLIGSLPKTKKILVDLLLRGDKELSPDLNSKICKIVQDYLLTSRRFDA
jgi:hypothetical protein